MVPDVLAAWLVVDPQTVLLRLYRTHAPQGRVVHHPDPMVEFGFKLRSYGSRLSYHRNERRKYHEAVRNYEEQARSGSESASLAMAS